MVSSTIGAAATGSQAERAMLAGRSARACCTTNERFLVIIVNAVTGEARTSKNLSDKDAVGVLAAMLDSSPRAIE